ncbi:ribonuclease Z [Candidatus Pacearchaeota archaeon]|nr:MAG: ribonuclease Z [Candidatus Pacearchaeota archaeon]
MEKIRLTFLGTGDAIPTKKRNHTAILLSYKNENILIDCGEGTQRQFKFAELSPMQLTRILITHWHGDHTLGLLGLLETLIMQNYSKKLSIYGPKGTKRYFSLLSQFLGPYKKLHKLNLQVEEVQGKFFENNEFSLTAWQMSHGVPANAYVFEIPDQRRIDKSKLKELGVASTPELKKLKEGKDVFIDGKKLKAKDLTYIEKGKKVCVVLDTKLNENIGKLARNADLLVSEATFLDKDKKLAEQYNHMTAAQVAKVAKKAKVKKLILTHISQRYEKNLSESLNEAKKIFPNTSLARDFDVVEL